MKFLFSSIILFFAPFLIFAQSYNTEKIAWVNYLIRMYENAPFEGVRVVDDYTSQHLISVLVLDSTKYADQSTLNRVASIKAASQASRFFNGSAITEELIIRTSEKSDGRFDSETIETIKEHSIGYVRALQFLTSFPDKNNTVVFIFSVPIESKTQRKK